MFSLQLHLPRQLHISIISKSCRPLKNVSSMTCNGTTHVMEFLTQQSVMYSVKCSYFQMHQVHNAKNNHGFVMAMIATSSTPHTMCTTYDSYTSTFVVKSVTLHCAFHTNLCAKRTYFEHSITDEKRTSPWRDNMCHSEKVVLLFHQKHWDSKSYSHFNIVTSTSLKNRQSSIHNDQHRIQPMKEKPHTLCVCMKWSPLTL